MSEHPTPTPLPTDPAVPPPPGRGPVRPDEPKKDGSKKDRHKPGTGEGEFPVHPDRPNAPDTAPTPDQELPEPPRAEPKKSS